MFIGSIIALTLSLSMLGFLVLLIVYQRVKANKAAAAAAAAAAAPPAGHVIPSNFIAAGATPPVNTPNRLNVVALTMHYYYWFTPVMAVIGLTIIFVVFYFLFRGRSSSSYTWYGSYRARPVCGGPNVIVVDQGYVTTAPVVAPVIVTTNRDPAPVVTQANQNSEVVEKR